MKLTEGLRKGDLNHLILPLISVDEFSSKIDDRTVIVVAFYSFEEDPAHDLSNFIERSPQNVLDTDVSPAPTKEGYYVTFVEIKRDQQFVPKLLHIVAEVSQLTDVKQWQFTSQKLAKGKVVVLNADNLEKWVDLKPKPKPQKGTLPQTDQLTEWFTHSALTDFEYDAPTICLQRAHVDHVYQVVSLQEHVPAQAQVFTEQAVSEASKLQRMLDGAYTVWPMGEHLVVEHHVLQSYLVLKQKI
jgi:hypothetical protein